MTSLILIPIIFGVILYKIPLKFGKIMLIFIEGFLGFTAVRLLLQSRNGNTLYEILGGSNHILNIGLRGDQLSLVFACLAILLFTCAFIYTYHDKFFCNRYILLVLVLQGVLTGIFFTDDVFNLFVLLEVATVVVTTMLMFKKGKRLFYDGLYYLMIQIVSMMFFLFGVAYLYKIFGVLSMSEIASVIDSGVPANILILPFAFIMTGICLKVGFFPLFSWVSRAYGTPSAPFAILAIMSGLYVKNNLYLFIRFNQMFYPSLDYTTFFLFLGLITGVVGFIKALSQKNINLILAYSTISQAGLITVGVLMSSEVAYWGSMYHIINHGIFKTLLFLTTGIIVKAYKTPNIYEIRGVLKSMPLVAIGTMIGILGMTGAPLFNGSISKYWLMAGSSGRPLLEATLWIINMGTMLTYIKYATILFGKCEGKKPIDNLKAIVIVFLSVLCLVGGIFGPQLANFLFGVSLYIDLASYLLKAVIYVGMVAAGILIYRYFIAKTKFRYEFWEEGLTLPQSCFVLLVFFVTLVGYGILTT